MSSMFLSTEEPSVELVGTEINTVSSHTVENNSHRDQENAINQNSYLSWSMNKINPSTVIDNQYSVGRQIHLLYNTICFYRL